jgi:DNA-binding IclR family transcriptional regulator
MAPVSKHSTLYILREISRHPNMSVAELAALLGVSTRTIYRYKKVLKEFIRWMSEQNPNP